MCFWKIFLEVVENGTEARKLVSEPVSDESWSSDKPALQHSGLGYTFAEKLQINWG